MIAAGTSICGVTAIVSVAPAIEADEREVAYAVANVVAFGLFGMLVYPYLAHAVLSSSETIGLFLGTAVHDTSQVVGAALTYKQVYGDDVVLRVATVTKLTRNIFLAAVIPLLTWLHVRSTQAQVGGVKKTTSWKALVPGFVIGFVAMAVVRTIGDATLDSNGAAFGIWNADSWRSITTQLGDYWASRILLGTAMAAVGPQHQLQGVQGSGSETVRGWIRRRRRRRRSRNDDGGHLRSLRPSVAGDSLRSWDSLRSSDSPLPPSRQALRRDKSPARGTRRCAPA